MKSISVLPDKVCIRDDDGSRKVLDATEKRQLMVYIGWHDLVTPGTVRKVVGHVINPETGEVERTIHAVFVDPVYPQPTFWRFEDGSAAGERPRTSMVTVSLGCLAMLYRDGRLEGSMFGPDIPTLKPEGTWHALAVLPRPRAMPRWS